LVFSAKKREEDGNGHLNDPAWMIGHSKIQEALF
jgi:hypothetical protein